MSGSQVVTVNSGSSSSITQQPASSSTVCAGTNVTTFVSASGTVSGYQWYRNGGVVSGQTSAMLTLPNTTTANSGSYVVVVTGACNSLTSTAFNLSVNPPPTVNLSNNGPLTCAQPSVTLTASGTSGSTYTFQGPSGSIASSGNTASVNSPGTYTITASLNGCTSTTTTIVGINTTLPTVSINPLATAICAGQSVLLTTNATTPGGTLSYRWDTPPATTSAVIVSTTGTYSVTVTRSDNGCFATATTSVTVNNPPTPSLTTQSGQAYPDNQSAVTVPQYSGSAMLEAKGCPGGSLQWRGPNGTTGTGNISVPTTTGAFVYQLTCQLNGCTSAPTSATVIVETGALTMLAPCMTARLGCSPCGPRAVMASPSSTRFPR